MQNPSQTPSAVDPPRALAAFEQLMLADARPGHPMTFFLECEVEGPLCLDRLRRGVELAAARHPLLRSRVETRQGRAHWLPPDVQPVVELGSLEAWRPIDLERESGLRLVVLPATAAPACFATAASSQPRHRVVMVAHHAALDGVAAGEFFGDLWACYHGHEPPPFATGGRRGAPDAAVSASDPKVERATIASNTWPFAIFRPRPLAKMRMTGGAVDSQLSAVAENLPSPFEAITLDRECTSRLRTVVAANRWSLNDAIVAAVIRAAGRWNEAAGGRTGNVRITLPVSLRPVGSRSSARNNLGYAFLDRTPRQYADRHELAASLAEASRWIVDTGAAAGFLKAAEVLARRPWLLRLITRLPICLSTAVVSTIGDPSRRMKAGVPKVDGLDAPADLVIRAIRGTPPLRPGTRAAIGATTYGGELTLSCLSSAGHSADASRAAARAFLASIAEELQAFLL